MHSRPYRYLAPVALIACLGGCVQATRHSNTMVFGTNTSFGIKVGTNVGETPEIVVGYDRQEAVIMPLVANTREHADPNVNRLAPCPIETPVVSASGQDRTPIHPCLLVGVNGTVLDSYSVLASFGAEFGAGTAPGASAEGGLAQYFATGVAAQMLALSGGAAVVAVGEAAEYSTRRPVAEETIASLYGGQAAFDRGVPRNADYEGFQSELVRRIEATEQNLPSHVQAFEQRIGSSFGLADHCQTKPACVGAVREVDPYRSEFADDPSAANRALEQWHQID